MFSWNSEFNGNKTENYGTYISYMPPVNVNAVWTLAAFISVNIQQEGI